MLRRFWLHVEAPQNALKAVTGSEYGGELQTGRWVPPYRPASHAQTETSLLAIPLTTAVGSPAAFNHSRGLAGGCKRHVAAEGEGAGVSHQHSAYLLSTACRQTSAAKEECGIE